MKIALVHYSAPPVVGGVERVLGEHARIFTAHGHSVRVVCGDGEPRPGRIEDIVVIPELAAGHPRTIPAQMAALDDPPGPPFESLAAELEQTLRAHLEDQDIVIVHNLMTMPFNLAATAALARLAARGGPPRFFNWIHDVAAASPDAALPAADRPPWSLLRHANPGFRHVAVSDLRRQEFSRVTGLAAAQIDVVPHGIDPAGHLCLPEPVARMAGDLSLWDRDIVLLHPARLVPRKKIEFGIELAGSIKAAGRTCLLLVTGAPDPHQAAFALYARALKERVATNDLGNDVVFVGDHFPVGEPELAGLYHMSDAVLLPSRHEGFGLPALEAALSRLPLVCPDIPPLNQLPFANRVLYDPAAGAAEAATTASVAARLLALLDRDPAFIDRKRVTREFRWERIHEQHLRPVLGLPG